jgi:hypothetical protein
LPPSPKPLMSSSTVMFSSEPAVSPQRYYWKPKPPPVRRNLDNEH